MNYLPANNWAHEVFQIYPVNSFWVGKIPVTSIHTSIRLLSVSISDSRFSCPDPCGSDLRVSFESHAYQPVVPTASTGVLHEPVITLSECRAHGIKQRAVNGENKHTSLYNQHLKFLGSRHTEMAMESTVLIMLITHQESIYGPINI